MKGWEVKALADVCQIRPPKAEARRKLAPTDLVSFVPMNDLGDDVKIFEPRETKALADVEGSYTYFAENDVLLAKITPCFENGKLGIARGLRNGVGFGSSEFVVLRPNVGLDAEYLYHFLSRSSFREDGAKRMTGAVGHKRIPKEFVEQLQIPLPPLDEQRWIVAILDEAFAGLAVMRQHSEANLKNARALFDSHLNAIFAQRGEGWVEGPLKKLIGDVSTGPFGSLLHKSDYVSNGIPLVNPAHIVDGRIVPDLQKTVSPALLKSLSTYRLKRNDIVIGRRGEIGRCAVVTEAEDGWLCGTGSFYIRPSRPVNSFFVAHLLRSRSCREALEKLSTGATMLNLSNTALGDFVVSIPSPSVQDAVISKADEILKEVDDLEALYRQKLAAIDELKQSILHRAFSGQLTEEAAPALVVSATPSHAANDNRHKTAMVLAIAFERHKRASRDRTFGHVKAQKILHMVEAEAGFDLGRTPRRDAAGPNDFPHMLAADDWAEATKHFSFTKIGEGYTFRPLANFEALTKEARAIEPTMRAKIDRIIDLFIPMDMQQSELFATVYAAWNNLLIEGKPVTDDAIISAAREGWHASKLKIDRAEFVKALRQLREKNCIPSGRAKFVQPSQQSDLFA